MQGWKKNHRLEKNQADPISADDEKLLWEKLLNTVFY